MSAKLTLAIGMAMIAASALIYVCLGHAGRPTRIKVEGNGIVLKLSTDGRYVLYGSSMGTIGVIDSHNHVEIARATSIPAVVCDITWIQGERIYFLQYLGEGNGFRLCSWSPHAKALAVKEIYRDNNADKYSRPTQIATVDLPEGPHIICISSVSGSVSIHRKSDGIIVFSGKSFPGIYSYKSEGGSIALLSSSGMTYKIAYFGGGVYRGEIVESLGPGHAGHRLFGEGAGSDGNGAYALSAVADAPSITNVLSLSSDRIPVASLSNQRTEDAPSSGVILPSNSIFIAYQNGEILAWRYEQWIDYGVVKGGWR